MVTYKHTGGVMRSYSFNSCDVKKEKMPRHIAIIMDGNGRWAKKRGLPRIAGHWAGAESLREIVKFCSELKIHVLSVFAFSTENWKRPYEEVNAIMNLLLYYFKREVNTLNKNNIKLLVTGEWHELPNKIVEEIKKSIELTKNNTGLVLNVVLNYGSRNEIINACKRICIDVKKGIIQIDSINENLFKNYLYSKDIPDPDLLIRPSGELRISNYLLWQIAYTELWFTDVMWPDFTRNDLQKALNDYRKRERRFGGLKK